MMDYQLTQLEHNEAIEKRLWGEADTLQANSNYVNNEYFLPVIGLVFLRHSYSPYIAVKDSIEANLPTCGGKTRALTKEDFSQQSAIFLQPKAQFDYLVGLPIMKQIKSLREQCDYLSKARDPRPPHTAFDERGVCRLTVFIKRIALYGWFATKHKRSGTSTTRYCQSPTVLDEGFSEPSIQRFSIHEAMVVFIATIGASMEVT